MDPVDFALACYRTPLAYQERLSLSAPLPEGMDRLLWLANGSPEALEAEVQRTGVKPQELRDAARFCIQRLCFARGANPYRVLGVETGTPPERIREHYRLLMRLFHPDRAAGREIWTDHYAARVNEAWTALSRPQSRPATDSDPLRPAADVPPFGAPSVPVKQTSRLVDHPPRPASGLASRLSGRGFDARGQRLPAWVLGALAVVTALILAGMYLSTPPSGQDGFNADTPRVAESRETSLGPPSPAPAADPGVLAAFLAAPDWQALERREQEARQRVVQAQREQVPPEQEPHEQRPTEETLLERMRLERARFEEQVKIEQVRLEQEWNARLAAERQRLEQLAAERVRAEQARAERQRLEEPARRERQRLAVVANRMPAAPVSVAVTASDGRDVTAAEVEDLINRYIHAYERGDLNGVMTLFAADARGKGSGDRNRIRQDYAALFATHRIRRLLLLDLRWAHRGDSARGSGRYTLQLQRHNDGDLEQLAGNIRFKIRKRDSRVLIQAIDYDWPGN